MRRRLDALVQVAGPSLLVVAVGVVGSFTSRATEIYFRNALVSVAIVVAIYVFVGNSGVLSFGQISFAAVGAFAAGVMTVPADVKPGVLPDAFSVIRDNALGNVPSLARLLGVPYIPITPFFPWLGPLGLVPLPSKWILEFGEPIRTDSYDAGEAEDPMLVFNVTDQVRETIQHTLFDLLRERDGVFS